MAICFKGVEFLGIDGLIGGNEVVAEAGDFVDVFEADDGEVSRGEAMLATVPGGAVASVRGFGPVDLAALARLAASCFSETGYFERDLGESASEYPFALTFNSQGVISVSIVLPRQYGVP